MNDLLRPDQTETYALISYDPATQPPYGDALDGGLNLGLRLADPRYEQALAQGKSPVWHAMGQEASYASRHVLLVATTNLTGTLWEDQARDLGSGVWVDTDATAGC